MRAGAVLRSVAAVARPHRGRFGAVRALSSSEKYGSTLMPAKTFGGGQETLDQQAFGSRGVLEEVKDDTPAITGWGIGQFRVNGRQISGPLVLTKKLAFRWNLDQEEPNVKDLKIEDFELFTVVNPPLDLIILGTGKKLKYPSPELLKKLRDIAPVEVLDSVNAGATFNLLSKEDREIAAALLPVEEW